MTTEEFFDDVIGVTAAVDDKGEMTPSRMRWRGREYTLVGVGRQWDTDSGRRILVEAAGGDRFELELSRQDLRWRLKRAWQAEFFA